MAAYYYTSNDEDPAVYHNNPDCGAGKKIEPENRVDSDTIPADRRLCQAC
jgi:hypothetical protein